MNTSLSEFIDIHCHILPTTDDGPRTMDESLAMARCYTEAGIRHVIATPHHIPGSAWSQPAEKILQKVEALQEAIDEEHITLTIHSGMEIALHKHMDRGLDSNRFLSLAGSDTYLLEPSFQDMSDEIYKAIKTFLSRRKNIIIAHPERVQIFQQKPERLLKLAEHGVQIQMNIGSLLGNFGNTAKKTARYLLKHNGLHYLASDAHSPVKRRPPTPNQWKKLYEVVGAGLETYCINNPNQLVNPDT